MSSLTISLLAYLGAAVAEIAGCFAFWAWFRLDRSIWWLGPGLLSLALFAYLLTRVDVPLAGRAYAVYGGIYIAASLVWLWVVEGNHLMAGTYWARWFVWPARQLFCLDRELVSTIASQ